MIEAVDVFAFIFRHLCRPSSSSVGRVGSRKSYFAIASTEDSFDLKDESRRANRKLFETTGSTARRNHCVGAMQFREHVGRARTRASFYNTKLQLQDFVERMSIADFNT